MKQHTLAMAADDKPQYEQYRHPTKRDTFLPTMERLVPWAALCEVIEPHYPKAGNGRPPVGLEDMLRIHFVQRWFKLADAACEDALLDSTALRRFVGIGLGRERVPDATTLLKFPRLREKHKLGEALFAKVGEVLQAHGLSVGTGPIVEATIIGAPCSTKNAGKQCDPEMHHTRKGQQWHFEIKLHIGADSKTGLAHSALVTAANVHDKYPLPQLLLHGQEEQFSGNCAYASYEELIQPEAPKAQDFSNQRLRKGSVTADLERLLNRAKSRVHARFENVFGIVKRHGPLSWPGQERDAVIRRTRTGQHLPCARNTVWVSPFISGVRWSNGPPGDQKGSVAE